MNRILSIARGSIPYVKEIMPLAHSIPGCILMQQLDYWFDNRPNGFYKFLSPCEHLLYKSGDSWSEELGMSMAEFRTAFDKIGIRYHSKTAFEAATDKFQGKFYCSYTDKRAQLTWYFRNHEVVDAELNNLVFRQKRDETPIKGGPGSINSSFSADTRSQLPTNEESQSTGDEESQSPVNKQSLLAGNTQPSSPVNADRKSHGNRDSQRHDVGLANIMDMKQVNSGITENNKDFQRLQLQAQTSSALEGSSSFLAEDLVFPAKIQPAEKQVLLDLLAGCPHDKRQQVLDEIEGSSRANKIKAGIVPFGRFLVAAVANGTFVPNLAVGVVAGRQAEMKQKEILKEVAGAGDVTWADISADTLAKMPAAFRQKAEQSRAGK